ncbi:uridine kinase [Arenicella sp. 4NH20-0111]|uniref:uridine kinase n=1 Tax=Arenicella sp. 4NH20-0111 TaxID=3127648 RepID=UPI003341AE99
MKRPVIAIAGASASGKTLFTRTVVEELCAEFSQDSLAVLEEDGYYRDQSHLPIKIREQTNYDHPRAFDHELLNEHLKQLKQGHSVEVPTYDYEEHTRSSVVRQVNTANVILVEGILLLADPDLCDSFDIKVFIDTPLDICLLRRIERDVNERGRSLQSVAKQYEATVRPMYHEFIEPSKQQADVVVTGGGKNRVAIEMVKQSIRSSLRDLT